MSFAQKTFWILSGGDVGILNDCNITTRRHFAWIGFFVLVILVLCFISCLYAFSTLFNSNVTGFMIACFFASVIFNLYLLLQTTISRNFLPTPLDQSKYKKIKKGFAAGIRLSFILFLSVVVAKPLEVILFHGTIVQEMQTFISDEKQKFELSLDKLYSKEEYAIEAEITKLSSNEGVIERDQERIVQLKKRLYEIENLRQKETTQIHTLIDGSAYFIQKIRLLSTQHKSSWIITFCFSILFFLPVILKYIVSGKQSEYYHNKGEKEKTFILREYAQFKTLYSQILSKQTGKKLNYSEAWEESPFNTRKKGDTRVFAKGDELLTLFYGESESD